MACILGMDVMPALEQAGLDLNWLNGVEPPKEVLDIVMACDDPLDGFWENLSSLFEDNVKGMLSFISHFEHFKLVHDGMGD